MSDVDTISTEDIPEKPDRNLSGIVVDINLRSYESVQRVRNKLRAEDYRELPRLFVLATALDHNSMQAWALGATDTISRPFDGRNSGADSLGIPRQRWIYGGNADRSGFLKILTITSWAAGRPPISLKVPGPGR